MNRSEQDYVEKVGRFWEAFGSSRTAGRILGYLMISDPPHQSAAELGSALGASAGSISTLTRQLETIGLVERVTFPGDRSSYFQMRLHAWVDVLGAKMAGILQLHDLAEAGRDLVGAERADRIDDLLFVTEFFQEEWPKLMANMKARLEQQTTTTKARA